MPQEDVRELFQRWMHDIWNADPDRIEDGVRAIIAPDFVGNWPEKQLHGQDELIHWVRTGVTFFTDLKITVDQGPIVDGTMVAGRWTLRGRYAGGLEEANCPVGTEIVFSGVDVLRVENGKFAECWVSSDQVNGLKQIGATRLDGCYWPENDPVFNG